MQKCHIKYRKCHHSEQKITKQALHYLKTSYATCTYSSFTRPRFRDILNAIIHRHLPTSQHLLTPHLYSRDVKTSTSMGMIPSWPSSSFSSRLVRHHH